MGCVSWMFSPNLVNFHIFPDFSFIDKNEWETFSPFSEHRRAKRAEEAISFVKKLNRNLGLKISDENFERMGISQTVSPVSKEHNFRGFRDSVLDFFEKFHDDFIFSPFFYQLANKATNGLFREWFYTSVIIEPNDSFFGWKWFANVIYTFNVVLTHHDFVLDHVKSNWSEKIYAHDKKNIQCFLKKLSHQK